MGSKLDDLGDSAKAYMPGDHLGRPLGQNEGQWKPLVENVIINDIFGLRWTIL